MKYINFKRYKFSTITKNLNTLRYNFFRIFKFIDLKRLYKYLDFRKAYKYLDFRRYDFFRIFKFIDLKRLYKYLDFRKAYKYLDFRRYDFFRIFKFIDLKRYDFRKAYKYLDFRRYNFYIIDKKINLKNYKYLPIYLVVPALFIGLVYVVIPIFYSYDKSEIEQAICKNLNIECLIKGEVNYSFYPTPRIKIKDLIINDFFEKKNILVTVESAAIKLSFENLLNKKKQNFKKIKFNNFEANINLKNLKRYKNIFTKKINFIPVDFKKGKIIFFDEKNYVATISARNLNLILEKDSKEAVLKGKFLNDNIYFSLNSKKVDNKPFTDVILKMSDSNLLIKANFFNSEKDKNVTSGNILIKKDRHRFTSIFNYKDDEITISKSNLKNIFLDGKLEGKIKILPYFNFNLDLSLNSINFTKLYNYFLALDEKNQKNLFKINRKINGKLNLSSDKIYSSYNLVKSIESRIKFNNGNISVEQFLVNLGKLGAADILGTIHNDKKFTNFKFESNIFIDNKIFFLSKFGIYSKQSIPASLFISGNFDLQNIRSSFYEISGYEKLSDQDVDFIEKEFNDFMLIEGYNSLFRFPKFKEFIKSITSETN